MNTVNASTGFSSFHLHFGRAPCIIPPLTTMPCTVSNESDIDIARAIINQLHDDVAKARDNLLATRVQQVHAANAKHSPEIPYNVGDKVMLST
ncbi:hypothetical protein POSPLADRAFT_1092092, partial [Postia placenta MAD-698-R-SB12]